MQKIIEDAINSGDQTSIDLAKKYADGTAGRWETIAVLTATRVKTRIRMEDSFKRNGVDPGTVEELDDTEVNETNHVTKQGLEQFELDFALIKGYLDQNAPAGYEYIFPRGFGTDAAEHLAQEKDGLPPGIQRINKPEERIAKKWSEKNRRR